MSWMAQFLRYPFWSCGIESEQQAAQGVNHCLTADCLAVAGKYRGFRGGGLADPTPGKAYGAHWLTR